MSKHWRPNTEMRPLHLSRARREWTRIEGYWPDEARGPMPEGAKVGLLLIAAACVGAAIAVYQVWGPRDVIARDQAANPNAAPNGDRPER